MLQVQTRIIRLVDIATVFFVFFFVLIAYFESWLMVMLSYFFFDVGCCFRHGSAFLNRRGLDTFWLRGEGLLFYWGKLYFYGLRIVVWFSFWLRRVFLFFSLEFIFFGYLLVILRLCAIFFFIFICYSRILIFRLYDLIALGKGWVECFPDYTYCFFSEKNGNKYTCYQQDENQPWCSYL